MKWITRSRVHVDRVACPWLISRFVDSTAEFLFVPASVVPERAAAEGAIPFDIPGAELGHHEGRSGLEAIALGFSRTCPEDHKNLDYQFVVYDALFAFFKLQVAKSPAAK